jgi:hypothetical protein
MSSSPERQAGTSGSTREYEQGHAQGQVPGQAQDRDYQAQDRDYQGQDRDFQGERDYQGRDYEGQGRDVQTREKDTRVAGREYPGGRHATGAARGAVIGFTALAGTLMLLGGLWMIAIAIVALSHSGVITTAPTYAFRFNPVGWGWLELGLGVLLFAAGMCVFLGMAWARYVGAFFAVLSAIANFVFIPYQPAWSILMIALDAAIIWALLTPRRTRTEF